MPIDNNNQYDINLENYKISQIGIYQMTTPQYEAKDNNQNKSLETRVAIIETDMGHIKNTLFEIKSSIKDILNKMDSNFKWLLGIYGGGFIFLLVTMAKGFHWF